MWCGVFAQNDTVCVVRKFPLLRRVLLSAAKNPEGLRCIDPAVTLWILRCIRCSDFAQNDTVSLGQSVSSRERTVVLTMPTPAKRRLAWGTSTRTRNSVNP